MRTFLIVAPDDDAIAAGLDAAPEVLVVDVTTGALPSASGAPGGVGAAIYARVSPLRSTAIEDELALAMQLPAEGIVLSGAAGLPDVEQLGAKLAVLEAEGGREDGSVRIVPLIDTAEGVLALAAMRPRPRLDAIAIDPAALARRIGCAPDAPAIAQALGMTILAAAACGVDAAAVAENRNPFAPHAEAAAERGPRSTRDHGASFETPAARAPQDEDVGSCETGPQDEDDGCLGSGLQGGTSLSDLQAAGFGAVILVGPISRRPPGGSS